MSQLTKINSSLDETNDSISQEVERVELLTAIQKIKLSFFSYIVAVIIYFGLQSNSNNRVHLLTWATIIIILRIGSHFFYSKLQNDLEKKEYNQLNTKRLLQISSLIFGLCWAVIPFFTYPTGVLIDIASYAILVAFLFSIIACYGIMALPRLDFFALFSIPIAIGVFLGIINYSIHFSLWVLLSFTVLIGTLLMFTYKLRDIYKNTLLLKLRNQELLYSVEKSQTKLKDTIKLLETQSLHDDLTSLPNRRHLMNKVSDMKVSMNNQEEYVLAVIDLDHFKLVNDKYGHLSGDKVLIKVAEILKSSIREDDLVARIGGEEFVIVLSNTTQAKADLLCQRILKGIENTSFYCIDNSIINITTSIGFTMAVIDEKLEEVFQRADLAVYDAKKSGRNCIKISNSVYHKVNSQVINTNNLKTNVFS